MASAAGDTESVGGPMSASGGPSNATVSAVPKSRFAKGSRTDVGWKYGISVGGSSIKIMCKFCTKELNGGISRVKHHLAKTFNNCEPCPNVPDEVFQEMKAALSAQKKKKAVLCEGGGRQKRSIDMIDVEVEGSGIAKKTLAQPRVAAIFKKDIREDACRAIARFFYNNAIPFNVARTEEFPTMCELIARHGQGFKPPSYHEIRVKYLKQEVQQTMETLEAHKAVWREVGCTLMTDGWTDKRRRTILNFLVNSPKGTVFLKSIDASHITKTSEAIFKLLDDVVEEIGEENVVQVVTDNAANYKAAGQLLMAKRKKLYWTPCAAHCIDLMLEDFEKKVPIHKETIPKGRKITRYIYGRTALIVLLQEHTKRDLVRPGMTRFATAYLTLGCLYENKNALKGMFASKGWFATKLSRTREGKEIEELVGNNQFWKDVYVCVKGVLPLIKVLRMVDSEEKPAMGYIYEAMDSAKEEIQKDLLNVKKRYLPLWNIIDERWDKQLHRPLHAAGFYLNPEIHYAPGFKVDLEVKRGLIDCLYKMVPDYDEREKISVQDKYFHAKTSMFGSDLSLGTTTKRTPVEWWEFFGDETPELQKFAIRVLGLTCSSSGCERNWSAFERVHTKKRNRLQQQKMNDVVFVMANSKLAKKKQARKGRVLDLGDVPSDDEWIASNEDANIDGLDLDENLDIEELVRDEELDHEDDNLVAEELGEESLGDDDDDGENLVDEVDGPENDDEDLMEEPSHFNLDNFLN